MPPEQLAPPVDVPLVDLRKTNVPLKESILADIGELLESSAFINGPPVEAFEGAFAAFCGTPYCLGVSSGTDALRLALLAAGLEPGDDVVVPAYTFIATFAAVTQAGGRPVVADVRDDDYNVDVAAVEAVVGSRTRVLMRVDFAGQFADMGALVLVSENHSLSVM